MNILYVGPYKQHDDNGILSKLYIEQLLQSDHHITLRPIYFNGKAIESNNQDLKKYEQEIYPIYDCLIQHGPIDWLSTHSSFKQNIAIPIFGSPNNLKHYQIQNLNRFTRVVVDNEYHEAMLVRHDIENIAKISCPVIKELIQEIGSKKINLGIHNDSLKFYCWANLNTDEEIIHKTLIAFYTAFRCEYGKSIVIFLEDSGQADQKAFMEKVSRLKSEMKFTKHKNSVSEFFVFKNLSFQEKMVIHNTCDVFLSIVSGQRSTIQEAHAKEFGNVVLNYRQLETVNIPKYKLDNISDTETTYESILTESLINNMRQVVLDPAGFKQKTTHDISNTLVSIL